MKKLLLVADGARGRLFEMSDQTKKYVEVQDFINPEAHLSQKEFANDVQGRSFDSSGQGRHSMQNKSDSKEKSKEQFAYQLVDYLANKNSLEKINQITIVAPSKFMGYMNAKLCKSNISPVTKKIIKDISDLSTAEINKYLEKESLVVR